MNDNVCPGCKRAFNTPQGLGMHFAWNRRKGDGTVRHDGQGRVLCHRQEQERQPRGVCAASAPPPRRPEGEAVSKSATKLDRVVRGILDDGAVQERAQHDPMLHHITQALRYALSEPSTEPCDYDDALDEARQAMTVVALEAANAAHDMRASPASESAQASLASVQLGILRINAILTRGTEARSKEESASASTIQPPRIGDETE